MTREATLCPNILNAIRIFTRTSKFLRFHGTKQTQNELERFFYNLAEFVFEYSLDSWRILASFASSFFSNRFSQHDRTVEPVPVASSSTRSSSSPSPTHAFWHDKSFQTPPPVRSVFYASEVARSPSRNEMSRVNT